MVDPSQAHSVLICSQRSSFYSRVWFATLLPIALCSVLGLVGLCRQLKGVTLLWLPSTKHCSFYSLLIAFMALPPVTKLQLEGLYCQSLLGGELSVLRESTTINCNSKEYLAFRASISVFIAIYLSTPLLFFASLYKQRHILNPKKLNDPEAIRLRNDRLWHLSFLFSGYRPEQWHFEIVDM